jgi:hypothetical protein
MEEAVGAAPEVDAMVFAVRPVRLAEHDHGFEA